MIEYNIIESIRDLYFVSCPPVLLLYPPSLKPMRYNLYIKSVDDWNKPNPPGQESEFLNYSKKPKILGFTLF